MKHNSDVQSFTSMRDPSLPNFQLLIKADRPIDTKGHKGRLNAPSASEVAVIMKSETAGHRDIVIKSQGGELKRIQELHPSYDALMYPFLYIHGSDGYNLGIKEQEHLQKSRLWIFIVTAS